MKESFNIYFLKEGGVYRGGDKKLDNLITLANDIINHVRNRYNELPEIYFDFIDSMKFKAKAAIDGDNYYIGMNLGLLNLMQDISFKINSDKGATLDNEVKVAFDKDEKGIFYDFDNGFSLLSFDNVNELNIAIDQYQLMFKFVLYHEIGHILRGHVGFEKSGNISGLEEKNNSDLELNINLYQTLEMDADSFATNRLFNEFYYYHINSERHKNTIYKDWESFIFNFTYSIYSFFRAFGFYTLDISKIKKLYHPEPQMRIALILSNIGPLLASKDVENIEELIKMCPEALMQAESDLGEITYFVNELEKVEKIFFEAKFEEYHNKVLRNWNLIRDDLQQYAFGELPPKSND